MGGTTRLLLVRHGESVDNVADAALSARGVLQARHLGAHLLERPSPLVVPTHIFASDLQRAYQTAEAIRESFLAAGSDVPEVQRHGDIRETDFGSLEGLPWANPAPAVVPDGWVHPETIEAILLRINRFLETSLFPVVQSHLGDGVDDVERAVVVVAHGALIRQVVNALVTKFTSCNCPVLGLPHGYGTAGFHISWRNTGFFECLIEAATPASLTTSPTAFPSGLKVTIQHMNCVDHLAGLTDAISSAKLDSKQKPIETSVPA
ncbi:uncharacterized protein DNG_06306 [Cephalotrichum gorgonifer]|uniref:His_Phos_1 domain-containing protein n=1 Tax=Cephalotrichum gorgonifer TaxID=2041049 RepID=A0AAE8N220_9PEZI|nr:uncharacterized protein DNG_06306 [Cephalotrichum gorgonifer]